MRDIEVGDDEDFKDAQNDILWWIKEDLGKEWGKLYGLKLRHALRFEGMI